MVCGEEKEKKVMFNKIVVENVEVGNGNKESTYRNRKTSIRTVLAGKCQVIDVGKFPATKSKVVYGVLLTSPFQGTDGQSQHRIPQFPSTRL